MKKTLSEFRLGARSVLRAVCCVAERRQTRSDETEERGRDGTRAPVKVHQASRACLCAQNDVLGRHVARQNPDKIVVAEQIVTKGANG